MLESVVELDQRSLGGMWSFDAYQREFNSPNSDLLVLSIPATPDSSDSPDSPPISPLVGIGCLWSILEEAHITVLAIHPDYWHQGFGQSLLYGLLTCAQQRGLEWATLEVRRSNQPALSLYQKFGFREVGSRKRYYKDTDEDALIFWRSGLHKPEFTDSLGQWEVIVRDRLSQSGWSLSIHL
nr:ribosomal protein S18-alanine N-acetyltransferase [Phormidium pseudopriestleyi]